MKGDASAMNISMTVSNGDLFIQTEHLDLNRIPKDFNVYRLKGDKLKQAQNYTEDIKISEPYIIIKGKLLKWGAAFKQIYVSDKFGWYREAAVEFDIADIKLLDDSTAVFWDGLKNNYDYNLKNHTVHKYLYETPLKKFLAFPVKTFVISSSGEQGHDFLLPRHVRYNKNADGNFSAEEDPDDDENEDGKAFGNTVNGPDLYAELTAINADPYHVPSLSEFRIDSADKRCYLEMIKKSHPAKYSKSGKNKAEKDFFLSMPKILDTLNQSTFKKMLARTWEQRNSREWITIGFINKNNDTLRVHHDYPDNRLAWNLPWEFVYHHQHFNSFSIDFSRFIKTCLPKSFVDVQYFDNKLLIGQIGSYLYNERKKPL